MNGMESIQRIVHEGCREQKGRYYRILLKCMEEILGIWLTQGQLSMWIGLCDHHPSDLIEEVLEGAFLAISLCAEGRQIEDADKIRFCCRYKKQFETHFLKGEAGDGIRKMMGSELEEERICEICAFTLEYLQSLFPAEGSQDVDLSSL